MKAKDIQVGHVYEAKVSGKLVPVRILRETVRTTLGYRRFGSTRTTPGREMPCWDAVNVITGRRIRIGSAQRLRRELPDPAGTSEESR